MNQRARQRRNAIDEKIIRLRAEGYTAVEIARRLRISPSSVGSRASYLMKQGRIPPNPPGQKKKKPPERSIQIQKMRKIAKLRESGWSLLRIANALGITYGTCRNYSHWFQQGKRK